MRKWTLILSVLLLASALPALAVERVTVHQLEQILADARTAPDADLAGRLAGLQLTQRLSSAGLSHWLGLAPGPRSQRALTALADRSSFLPPPSAELPGGPAPALDKQRQIMGLAAVYVTQAIPQLPRFYATRTITHFDGDPASASDPASANSNTLRATRISRATVQYRDGEEITNAAPVEARQIGSLDQGLRTWGVFGPILSLVLLDAAQNHLAWSHWEQDALSSPIAVFSYSVPRDSSHYQIRYCCVVSLYGLESSTFQQMTGYHGQIAVDPATGAIVRLVLQADLEPDDPISRADLMVEYSPVELGGATYVCPTRSVSISVARTIRSTSGPSGRSWPVMGPLQMLLNDARFSEYHLFRADTRVLSGNEERTAGLAPDVTLPAPAGTAPSEELLSDAGPAAASPASPVTASAVETPEISTAEASALPDTPQHPAQLPQPPGPEPSGFTLRINARLVDVNIVALDKKGRPIPNLTAGDFEVYDNDVKQDIRDFSQADAPSAAAGQAPALVPATFSNRPGAQPSSAAKPAPPAASPNAGNTLVFLIDPANLVFNDLADVRRQMLHFLSQLQPNERVALYAMRYHGFQVLQEATADHAAVATRLARWMPTAQDLLNARDQEDRNRQHIETVRNLEDMLSVNGNFTLDPMTQQEGLDSNLRELGSNSGPNALAVLVDVAGHLAPMAGHKSVVWVTSDNALADWNRMSVSIEKHSKFIEPAALRAQEAMNDAHASVYPLDASRLEANVITADLANRNVQLTETYPNPTQVPAAVQAVLTKELGPEATAGSDDADPQQPHAMDRNFTSNNRLFSQMQQDMRPIEGVFREVAEATGGRTFRRSSNIEGELNGVVAESHATYLLGFTPSRPADGQYHRLTVKLIGHRDATLRYRTGYNYTREPTSLKERFAQAVWQPTDAAEIGVTARPVTDAEGQALRVTVAGVDLDLTQQTAVRKGDVSQPPQPPPSTQQAALPSNFWSGKVDIFLVQRDEEGQHARVTGQTVGLRLKPGTYQHALNDGLTFDERIPPRPGTGSLRIVVVDVNSGRIGTVTIPTAAIAPGLQKKSD